MNEWYSAFFGQPEPPKGVCDCDDCKAANPDWYRMGMAPRKPKPRDLSRTDPRRFLDTLLWLREHHQEDEADQSSGQTFEQFLSEKRSKKKHKKSSALYLYDQAIGDAATWTFTPMSGGGSEDDE